MACEHGHLDQQQCIGYRQGIRDEQRRILDIIADLNTSDNIKDDLIHAIASIEPKPTCSQCLRQAHARGLCQAHYRTDLRRRHARGDQIRKYATDELGNYQTSNGINLTLAELAAQIQTMKGN